MLLLQRRVIAHVQQQLLLVLLLLSTSTVKVVVQAQGTTYEIPWRTPIPQFLEDGDPLYEDRFDYEVGDTIVFQWAGIHNVYIHTSGLCVIDGDLQSRILIAESTGQPYVIPDYFAGRSLFFVCEIGQHCENGLHVTINVNGTPIPIPDDIYVIPTPTAAPGLSPLPDRPLYGQHGKDDDDTGNDDDDGSKRGIIIVGIVLGVLFIVGCCCCVAIAVYCIGKRNEEREQQEREQPEDT